jgi:hypothetical protein
LRSCSEKTRRQEPAGLVARAFSRKLGRDEPANRSGISQSWTTLAGQLDRLAQIIKDEDEEGGLDQPN